jgi:DNA-binding transcriptional ArsR family regulator
MTALNLPFKALADPTRRKIIMLLKKESLTPGEIAEHLLHIKYYSIPRSYWLVFR